MATSPFIKHSDRQVCRSISYGRSTTQLCLKKIIDIIMTHSSSVRPCEVDKTSSLNLQFESEVKLCEEKSSRSSCFGKRGFDIDLNLRLGPALDTEEDRTEDRGFSACSGVGEAFCGIAVNNSGGLAVFGEVSTVEKSSEGECDPKEIVNSSGDFSAVETNKEEGREVVEEETREFSEITNLRVQSSEIETKRVDEETEDVEQSEIEGEEQEKCEDEREKDEKKEQIQNRGYKSDGYLGLLVEAARLISGNFENEDEPELDKPSQNGRFIRIEAKEDSQKRTDTETRTDESIQCGSKRNGCWMFELYEDFEDISPVVRSKRGRNQVLPYRYRDSVLEPLKRLSNKQRSPRVSAKPRTN